MSAFVTPIERVRLTAEARLKLKEERKTDADKVWVELAASRTDELLKTDRLRALRLAKEAADRATAAAAIPKIKNTARKKSGGPIRSVQRGGR